MIEVNFQNKKGKLKLKSKDVLETLRLRPDFEYVEDISNTINQKNIMVFDCSLDKSVFRYEELEDLIEELGEDVDESYFQVLFEDIRAYLKDACDEIEADLQEEYTYDNLRCYFEIYDIDDTFTDVKFVFVISFANIKIASLMNLTKIISKRLLQGESKYYN
ncbi:MAG TPA: hypothetical protein VLM81_04195 [Peptostreptococcaceae bacterium]|nr:hypothetical protein [Peptostreptococcaceae bacterium]